MTFLVSLLTIFSSFVISGEVKNAESGEAVQYALVRLSCDSSMNVYTNAEGRFLIQGINASSCVITVSHPFYESNSIKLLPGKDTSIVVLLKEKITETPQISISGVRAPTTDPVTQKTLSREAIERNYFGQEMPFLLEKTPSILSNSDAGSYTGYSYFRLRGIDQTRINVTLNGVPLNEPEDQGVYFSNFPDFANSIQSLQVQRGVGTSSFGTASYGGSINIESISPVSERPEAELQIGYGSFSTYRVSAEYKTGMLKDKVAFYGRYSMGGSEGYRDHSGNDYTSFFLSGVYLRKKSSLQFTSFSGRINNQMSYLPASEKDIKENPTINYLSESEKDRFGQDFVQFQYTTQLNDRVRFTASPYYIRIAGNYDVYFPPDMYNFGVSSNLAGLYSNLQYSSLSMKVITGLHLNTFQRDHFSSVRPAIDSLLYLNTGYKKEWNGFVKYTWRPGRFQVMVDLQVRGAYFRYEPDRNYSFEVDPVNWIFVNPKAGISYKWSKLISVYSFIGRTGREPARNDMFAGFDDMDTSNLSLIGDLRKVKPEYVTDVEAGVVVCKERMLLKVNFFHMEFKNEIAAIGQLSYIGLPLRKNVASSYRTGVEADVVLPLTKKITVEGMLTLSRNRIREYFSEADSSLYKNVNPLLTPQVIGNISFRYTLAKRIEFELEGRGVSASYLDNTDNEELMVPSYFIVNAKLAVRPASNLLIKIAANNIGNRKYFTSGYVVAGERHYFVQPPGNYFVTLQFNF